MFSNTLNTQKFATIFIALMLSTGFAQAKHPRNAIVECLYAPTTHFDGTIAEAAIATPDLSTLVQAVSAAGLVDALNAPGKLTVFAPTNDAFAAIPGDLLNAILADPEGLLTSILTYHLVPRKVDPRWIWRYAGVKTLQGQRLFTGFRSRNGIPVVNNANLVSCSPVRTSNGVVWIIDSVLLPQFQN